MLQTIRTILELYGYRVLTARNGEMGVQAVRDHLDELALVILDSTMPVMSGEVALGHMKTLAPRLPVILASGYDVPQVVSRLGEHKLAGFIRKPFMFNSLLVTVKSVLQSLSRVPVDRSLRLIEAITLTRQVNRSKKETIVVRCRDDEMFCSGKAARRSTISLNHAEPHSAATGVLGFRRCIQ